MNLKNLLKLSTIVMIVTLVFSSMTFAQTTVFVDNTPGVGNDFNNGLAAASPKATIGSALAAFPSGTTIKVKGTGLLYNETVDLNNGVGSTTGKEYVFDTYDSTAPIVTGLVVNLTAVAAPYKNEVTFNGPFVLNNGLALTAGDVLGAQNLTVKTAVTITEGTVDAQLQFSGSVNFTYNGVNDRTTAGELPAGSDATHFGSLTLALGAAKTVTLNESKIVNGTFTSNAASTFALGSNTLTLTKNVAHANTGDITASSTGGVIVDLTNGAASFANAGALPNVTAKNGSTLTIGASISIGSLTADAKAGITLSTAAAVTIDDAKGTGNIKNLSEGTINYSGAGGLTVKGNVEQSGSFTAAGKGLITFTNGVVTVNGNVTNSATVAISTTTAAVANTAMITFNNAAHVIKGAVNLTGSGSITSTTGLVGHILTVEFAATGATVTRIDGGISNSASLTLSSSNKTEITLSGSVLFNARTAGDIGTAAAGQSVSISNTASITAGYDDPSKQNGAIDLDAGASLTGGVLYAGDVVTSGADGGYMNLGRANVASVGAINISGNLTNARTAGKGTIVDGSAGAVSVGGDLTATGSKISFTGALASMTVGGLTNVNGGTVEFPGAVNATSFSGANGFSGGVTITSGKLDVSGGANITANVASGSLTFSGGTLVTGTGVRTWTTTAINNAFGGATGNTTITPNDYTNGTEFIFATPAYAQVMTITVGGSVPVIPGKLTITNGTALPINTIIKGGNLRVLGDVTLNTGAATRHVQLDGTKLIVGQSLGTPLGNGSFTNTTGYETVNQGAVSLNGGINPATLALANQAVSGAGAFGNLEIDVAPDPGNVTAALPGNALVLKENLYLTRGAFDNSVGANNISFSSTSIPTIIRNAGTLKKAPSSFGTKINITYIGSNKTASYEMEAGATSKLNDLTVATTDGSVPGKGVVEINGAVLTGTTITVGGILTVNVNQALLLTGADLVLAGATAQIDGDVCNTAAGDQLQFGSKTGTTVNGSGWLPDVSVLATSVGNVINGAKGLVTTFLGADGLRGGVGGNADFDPTTTTASGSITYGAGTAALKVIFGAGAKGGTQVNNITTGNSGNALEIAGNLVEAGNVNHGAGTITVDSSFTWKYNGIAPALTGKAVINGKGWLIFTGNAAQPVIITGTMSGTTAPTIDVPVEINLANAGDGFQIKTTNFVMTNSLTVTKGKVELGDPTVPTAFNLTLTGSALTVKSDGSFDATAGLGILVLKATVPPMSWSYTGTPTMGNVTVSADVNLVAGDNTATALTVNGMFKHDGGVFNFGDMNLTVAGGFTRTDKAGGYTAGKGYLIFTTTAAIHQSTGFSIPNLRLGNASAVSFTFDNGATDGVVTVTKKLYVDNATANKITLNGKLAVSNGADVYYQDGQFDAVPTYGSTINLHAINTAARTIDATVWPATTALVQILEINNGAAVSLPGDRQINTVLTLTAGNLDLNKKLTVKNASTINVVAGTLTNVGGGSVVYGIGNTVNYLTTAYYKSGLELPATVKTLNISRNANGVNNYVLLASSVTVTGDLTVKNNLATSPQAALSLDFVNPAVAVNTVATITLKGDLTITKDAFALATDPVTNFGSSLTFAGTYNQAITVPSGGSTIGDITINTSTTSPVLSKRPQVILHGGDLETGVITFESGLFVVPDSFTVTIPTPTLGVGGGQGFIRNVADGNISHIVGKVSKKLVNSGTLAGSSEPRSEFPVGSMNMYRPAAITFNMAFGVPTNPNTTITVSHVDSSAGGAAGLPIKDGVAAGIDVSRYPAMYWSISSSNSLSNSVVFDLELQASGFSDFDDINNVRIIRRYGIATDITNQWLLQGISTSYDNAVNAGVPTVIQKGTFGGLRSAGAVFTLGMTSKMSVANPIADQTLMEGGEAKTVNLSSVFTGNRGSLTFTAQSSNATKVTVSVKDAVLTLTPVAKGDADITVVASDAANTDFYATTFHVTVEPLTDVKTNDIPKEFALMQNYPNPFNPTTNIKFDLPKESNVTLKVYNVLGEEVATLVNTVMPAGHQEVKFDATRFASGLYIYRIQAGSFVQVKKMMLMK